LDPVKNRSKKSHACVPLKQAIKASESEKSKDDILCEKENCITLRYDIDICIEIVWLIVNLSWIILIKGLFTPHPSELPGHIESTTQYCFSSQLRHPVQEFTSHGILHNYWDGDNIARAGAEYSGVTRENEIGCVEN